MDIRMPQLTGIEATRRVVALGPTAPRVVLLTTFDLDEYVFDGLLAGASGFLLKHAPPEEILLAVRAAAAGDANATTTATAALVRGRDDCGHFDPEPRPSGDFDAGSRAAHAAAVEQFFESNKLLAARRKSGNVGI